MCNTPVEVQFTSDGCLNYPCRTPAGTWNAFFLPKGTPAAIVQKLHAATVKAMETPSVQQRLKDIAATVMETERRSPEYLQKFVESEIEKWTGPIKASGLSMD
jgi:tripartite-type tricarboxylate transporter receptor subunit TctC